MKTQTENTLRNGNRDAGRYAVAAIGMRGWRQDAAIGDGITSALCSLYGRYETRDEAEQAAAKLNADQPQILPGSPSVSVYDARVYLKADYLSRQQREQNACRECDRRIV